MSRIVNINYIVAGLRFDAAIDCDWEMHAYNANQINNKTTPIELYCFDHKDWGIKMIYQEKYNEHHKQDGVINRTFCDFDNIIEETKKWIKEMTDE